ncbi:hypothetical protein SAMN05660748_1452 [Blastococcus aggregatus]|uniref:Sporulation and spore germination n=1 Tax=Blastococcus aggregatus TaxID=38502 RepID=A0A285V3N4_9ACTN|nr:hypothetical protein [Blastococcus aggregatus]SOC48744.1 hypothetical protein SAMN05660748_1452 [Blastococcus aggregatus]
MGPVRTASVLLAVLLVAACAEPSPGSAPPPHAQPPADPDALVLRVEQVGGYTTPQDLAARLPVVSVYADGQAILQGPVPAIYPAFAWPNIQVLDLGADGVQELVDHALAAGVAEQGDLGAPHVTDMPSTRFTLRTAEGTHVREVYALTQTTGTGLTEDQLAARERLLELLTEVQDLSSASTPEDVPESWTPAAVAAVVEPWTAREEDTAQGLSPEPLPWPGPPLPGEPIGPGISCVVATGEVAGAVVTAAQGANMLTPWATPDGALWSVAFRPLLPDETGCADLQA